MTAYPSHHSSSTSDANKPLLRQLSEIVGEKYTLTSDSSMSRFCKGIRFGQGRALAVVQPGSLVEQWRVLKACIKSDVIVLMQAANTGVTGGSTPDGDDYDRDIVIISTLRMDLVHVIHDGKQVVCLPGATLFHLEKVLAPLGREPHSVIGSSCIGASVIGGVANNSGGALVRRGPAYTEFSVYAQCTEEGEVTLVNHLGIELGRDPEDILTRLEKGDFTESDISDDGAASDHHYQQHVREVDADTPARFNADPARLYESSGNAGKLCLFAVRMDTFEQESSTVFYVGSNKTKELSVLRRALLEPTRELPIACEYMHRSWFDIAADYGKDTFLLIEKFGTDKIPQIFALKGKIDAFFARINVHGVSDRIAQWTSRLFPDHLPKRMREYRDRYEHHLMLKVPNHQVATTREVLAHIFEGGEGDFFQCTEEEGNKAFLHRFAAGGSTVRYRLMNQKEVGEIVALDVALRRNDEDWFEQLPDELNDRLVKKLYCGHFLCHVMHQDYVLKKGESSLDFEHAMWKILDQRGAEYPAEHNVGHLYKAKPSLKSHYMALDPCNCFNPGIGQTSKLKYWGHEKGSLENRQNSN
ncbi:Quinone-dependent D-lactate dehydrogenase [Halomonadaceae bacterium LMG 33818]|uniref:D-lactate dehydrogenase n=1 Tax=Cernens ardua TaxID=3402176 RepID=UPI003EDC8BA9